MRLDSKKIKVVVVVLAMLLSVMTPAVHVQAATGKTTIAVSSGEIDVGDTVTITVKAKTESGGNAKAKMELSYDEDILEFVSCSATYDGGAGGSVTATASSMTVKFKAIAEGKSPIYVEASNGVDSSSGNSLSSVEASSTNIVVNEASAGNSSSTRLSADNSLKTLSLSAGTLSPEFKGSTVNYTATVPNDVTSLEINAETSNAKATIESITGNTNLQVGQNDIKIVVKAENETTATYTIEVTRQEATETTSPTENTESNSENTELSSDDGKAEELEEERALRETLANSYKQLEEKYQREKAFSRSVIYVLIFIIAILLVGLINVVLHYRRKLYDDDDDIFAEERPVKKKQPPKVEERKPEKKEASTKVEKTSPKVEKVSTKVEKVSTKVETRSNKFEVFDFNDED